MTAPLPPSPRDSNVPIDHEGVNEAAQRLLRRPWPDVTPIRTAPRISFEFFPPATQAAEDTLWRSIDALRGFRPAFVSMTYGAGGTTQDRTIVQIERLRTESDFAVAGHLTCVGRSKDETDEVVERYVALGVSQIVALRGDPPEGSDDGRHPDGYADAAELVAGIRRRTDLPIAVGAYPEVHPRATSAQADLDNLKRKIDAGADCAITQFFFDAEVCLRFIDRARAAGINVPIVPGIMPIGHFGRVRNFAERCGASVPAWLVELFAGLDEVPEVRALVAATIAAEQCRRLAEHGITDLHFYTLNQADLTVATCEILGIQPDAEARVRTATRRRAEAG